MNNTAKGEGASHMKIIRGLVMLFCFILSFSACTTASPVSASTASASISSSSTSVQPPLNNSAVSPPATPSYSTATDLSLGDTHPPIIVQIDTAVWIPSTGTKYHASDICSGMNDPTQIPLQEAVDRGYEACELCFGEA